MFPLAVKKNPVHVQQVLLPTPSRKHGPFFAICVRSLKNIGSDFIRKKEEMPLMLWLAHN